jgi:hypothetical protein
MTAVAVTHLREFSVNEEDFLTKATEGYLLSPTKGLSRALLRQSCQEVADGSGADVPGDHYSLTGNLQDAVCDQRIKEFFPLWPDGVCGPRSSRKQS